MATQTRGWQGGRNVTGEGASMGTGVLLACLALTLVNVGMIWFLQLNHYPLYRLVGEEAFRAYMAGHNARLLVPVILPGGLAVLLSFLLAWVRPPGVPAWSVWLVIASGAAILLSTALIQGPAHAALARDGYSAALIQRVVATNWIRTAGWTLNAALLLWMASLLMDARQG